jgi:hypothetical protein
MTARPVPTRHWWTYGNNHPLPTDAEALDEPFAAFPSWFMRVSAQCGRERMFNEVHMRQRAMPIHDIIDKMRHDGCGGRGREGGPDHRHRGRQ